MPTPRINDGRFGRNARYFRNRHNKHLLKKSNRTTAVHKRVIQNKHPLSSVNHQYMTVKIDNKHFLEAFFPDLLRIEETQNELNKRLWFIFKTLQRVSWMHKCINAIPKNSHRGRFLPVWIKLIKWGNEEMIWHIRVSKNQSADKYHHKLLPRWSFQSK